MSNTDLQGLVDRVDRLVGEMANLATEVKLLAKDVHKDAQLGDRVLDLERKLDRAIWHVRGAWFVLTVLGAATVVTLPLVMGWLA